MWPLAWEVPGPGYTLGKTILALGYRNVYYRTHEFKQFAEETDEPGWADGPGIWRTRRAGAG